MEDEDRMSRGCPVVLVNRDPSEAIAAGRNEDSHKLGWNCVSWRLVVGKAKQLEDSMSVKTIIATCPQSDPQPLLIGASLPG